MPCDLLGKLLFNCGMVSDQYQQVMAKRGGGVRCTQVEMNETLQIILDDTKRVFIPNDESRLGPSDKFTYVLWDFKHAEVQLSSTGRQHVIDSKVCKLRFYQRAVIIAYGSQQRFAFEHAVQFTCQY
jgi:hypothetical protein